MTTRFLPLRVIETPSGMLLAARTTMRVRLPVLPRSTPDRLAVDSPRVDAARSLSATLNCTHGDAMVRDVVAGRVASFCQRR